MEGSPAWLKGPHSKEHKAKAQLGAVAGESRGLLVSAKSSSTKGMPWVCAVPMPLCAKGMEEVASAFLGGTTISGFSSVFFTSSQVCIS